MTRAVPGGEHWHQPLPGWPAPAGSHLSAGQLPAQKPNRTCAGSSSGPPKSSPTPKPTSPDRESLATAKAPDRPLECQSPPAVRLSELYFQCLCTTASVSFASASFSLFRLRNVMTPAVINTSKTPPTSIFASPGGAASTERGPVYEEAFCEWEDPDWTSCISCSCAFSVPTGDCCTGIMSISNKPFWYHATADIRLAAKLFDR